MPGQNFKLIPQLLTSSSLREPREAPRVCGACPDEEGLQRGAFAQGNAWVEPPLWKHLEATGPHLKGGWLSDPSQHQLPGKLASMQMPRVGTSAPAPGILRPMAFCPQPGPRPLPLGPRPQHHPKSRIWHLGPLMSVPQE